MNLKRRTITLLILIPIAALSIFFYLCNGYFLKDFTNIEKIEVADKIIIAKNYILSYETNLNDLNKQWSVWDDAYQFSSDLNKDFISKNMIKDEFSNLLNIDFMVFVNNNGKVIYSKEIDSKTGNESAISNKVKQYIEESDDIKTSIYNERGKSGFINLENRIILLSCMPILRSNHQGPINGYLVMGRYIHDDQVDFISKIIGEKVNLLSMNNSITNERVGTGSLYKRDGESIYIRTDNKYNIETYLIIKDIKGNNNIAIAMEKQRDIYNLSFKEKQALFYTILIITIVCVLSTIFVLNKYVFKLLNQQNFLLKAIPAMIFYKDREFKYSLVNKYFEEYVNREYRDIEGKSDYEILDNLDEAEKSRNVDLKIKNTLESELNIETKYVDKHGKEKWISISKSPVFDDKGKFDGILGIIFDVTHAKAMAEKINLISFYDDVTLISNRNFFIKNLSEAIERSKISGEGFSILYIGVDNFKIINETLGHLAGDELLRVIAQRITENVKTDSIVSRIGGDEFALIFNKTNKIKINNLCIDILRSVRKPWEYSGVNYHITVSIGVALYPQDGNSTEELIKNSQIAISLSKANGKNNFLYYLKEHSKKFIERVNIVNDLRGAIAKNEFVLYYQPQINTITKKIIGLEALIRWKHPERGMVSPGVFIPVAEESGLIIDIGKWVIQEACRQIKEWNNQGFNNVVVSVNVSAKQFQDKELVDFIKSSVEINNIKPSSLEIEITESAIMRNREGAVLKLNQIKSMGISILLDDFGTGYSSLLYLKSFPIDVIKIDQNFVKNMIQNIDEESIVKTIIILAKDLKMKTIAEGVETEEQYEILKDLGCDQIQGYLFGRPSQAEDIEVLLKNDIENKDVNSDAAPAEEREVVKEDRELLNSVYKIINILDSKENDIEKHSENVAKYSVLLGVKIGLSDKDLLVLKMGSFLHDCGKLGLDKKIIEKDSELSVEEYGKVKDHSLIGYNIVRYIVNNKDIEDCVLYHHERWNGTGYPKGLKEKDIPIYSRIISIADAYESMISDRPFRKALSNEKAIEELQKGKYKQFDPELIDLFIEAIKENL
ncbi:EAL domain-containing protein [Clostridium sp. PL3]|uniref:EAL domain-containing protein n=1 Tax=Clostridium thailandense TaxID=2794346 RepID=A0A949TLB1_9CLOT|nr:EAL domain-containing protein [Clostridium thailandense]MBV7274425.1 EAL domain-containing protein [Clostridium thailandense]